MKTYITPEVTDYGSLLAVTGVTGNTGAADIGTYLTTPPGETSTTITGTQSVNRCASPDNQNCI